MKLIFLGAPGAGKGTQARRLMTRLSIPQISTGDLFRSHQKNGTELGQLATGYMDRGELVPDAVVVDMVRDRMDQSDCDEGFILDGFPRNLDQAESLASTGVCMDHVVEIKVPDEDLVTRLTGRVTCRGCGKGFHCTFSPPVDDRCDGCGGEDLYTRVDDTEETVRHRLAVYHDQTAPLIDFYSERSLLRSVDGVGGEEAVFGRLCESLGA